MKDNYSHMFNHLSLKDLIEARDLFHIHLMNNRNVIATAIGRYLIRKSDLDSDGRYHPRKLKDKGEEKEKRVLTNSAVMDFSWPCILVFVEKWEQRDALITHEGSNLVPKTLYMPDGRVVPVCIVEATRRMAERVYESEIDIERLIFPGNYIGGGFPLILNSQCQDRIATAGCLVSDGNKFFAVSNKHVIGDGGNTIYTKFHNRLESIGVSSGIRLGKEKFSKLYSGWGSENIMVSCDAGLIEIEDINRWKTDILGIGQIDELLDLNTNNLSLGLISDHRFIDGKVVTVNNKICGYGAVTGKLEGEIIALFYRYKSIGGIEYVSDFLIGGRDGSNLDVHHGDSGTIWMMEDIRDDNRMNYKPFALHWGQHEFIKESKRGSFSYSLATNLTNVCRELDVDIVRGWNIDNEFSWGKVGHYTMGKLVSAAISDPELKDFIKTNAENISLQDRLITADLNKKKIEIAGMCLDPEKGFCALADVPDLIWKQTKLRSWGRQGDENPNHYADADAPAAGGKTLFDICNSKGKLTPDKWIKYNKDIDRDITGITKDNPEKYGLLCFRVWQIYDYMVSALKGSEKKGEKLTRFLFAAGVLAHYVGDACMPLHSSYMSDGDPKDDELKNVTARRTSYHRDGSISHEAGDVYQKVVNPGKGVHSAYEDQMIDANIQMITDRLKKVLNNGNDPRYNEPIAEIDSGQAAGFASFLLMKKTQETIPPSEIVELYKKIKGPKDISKALYDQLGDRTIECLARGCRYLAAIWESAWIMGGGKNLVVGMGEDEKKVDQKALTGLYKNPAELPSLHLGSINNILQK